METSRGSAMDDFRMDWAKIKNRILKAGEKAGLKDQTAIVKAAGGTLKQQEISALGEIKNGKQCTITAEKLARIARACDVSLDWLIFGDQENTPEHDETWDTLRPYGDMIIKFINDLRANLVIRTYRVSDILVTTESDSVDDGLYVKGKGVPSWVYMVYMSLDIPLYPLSCDRYDSWFRNGYGNLGEELCDLAKDISHAHTSNYNDIRDKEIQAALNEHGGYVLPKKL